MHSRRATLDKDESNMKSLLIVAHGSRKQSSNDEVRSLAQGINIDETEYDFVECAFLELAEPSIPDGLERCIERGAHEIVVMPYFLAAGRHVSEDIPKEVSPVIEKYRDVQIRITPHLGASPRMTDIILGLTEGNHSAHQP
jgi:sirohydrochlorin ferrochelatase